MFVAGSRAAMAEWQTRRTQNPMPSKGVGVQVPLAAPMNPDLSQTGILFFPDFGTQLPRANFEDRRRLKGRRDAFIPGSPPVTA